LPRLDRLEKKLSESMADEIAKEIDKTILLGIANPLVTVKTYWDDEI
jgi:hypothetical protein